MLGEFDIVTEHTERGIELADELGARRFVARALHWQAKVAIVLGRISEAVDLLQEAIAISRETGVGYIGAALLGTLAVASENSVGREDALKEGEQILQSGCVGHNFFEFYEYGMDACLKSGQWDRVEQYADALEDYTKAEPLPRTDFAIARGRILSTHGRGQRDEATQLELQRVRNEAARVGLNVAISALDEALG